MMDPPYFEASCSRSDLIAALTTKFPYVTIDHDPVWHVMNTANEKIITFLLLEDRVTPATLGVYVAVPSSIKDLARRRAIYADVRGLLEVLGFSEFYPRAVRMMTSINPAERKRWENYCREFGLSEVSTECPD